MVLSMIVGVISCIAAIYAFRWYLVHGTSGSWGRQWGGIIASVLNSIQIQVLNVVYKIAAVGLTGEAVGF